VINGNFIAFLSLSLSLTRVEICMRNRINIKNGFTRENWDAGTAFLKKSQVRNDKILVKKFNQKPARAIVIVASWNSRFNRMRTAVPVIFLSFFFFNVIYRYNVRVTIKQYANGIEDFSFGGGCLYLARSVHSRRGIPLVLRHFALYLTHFLTLSLSLSLSHSFSLVSTLSLVFVRLK